MEVIGSEKALTLYGLAKDGCLLMREGLPVLWTNETDARNCRTVYSSLQAYDPVPCHIVVRAP